MDGQGRRLAELVVELIVVAVYTPIVYIWTLLLLVWAVCEAFDQWLWAVAKGRKANGHTATNT